MAIFESSQSRFRGGYWDNWDAYVRNSPIARASKVRDAARHHAQRQGRRRLDFTQGVEYLATRSAARRSPSVMLEQAGENQHPGEAGEPLRLHGLRMREYFDHHLKGAPAPAWWTDGVPRLDRHGETPEAARRPSRRRPRRRRHRRPPPRTHFRSIGTESRASL